MKPSPAPRRSRRRLWPWIAATVTVGAAGVVGGAASYPRWAAGWVEEQVETRLQSRLGQTVEVERVELAHGLITLLGVRIGDLVELDRVEIQHAQGALWRGRLVVERVVATGGSVRGSVEQLRQLARRFRPKRDGPEDDGSGHRLVPDTASVEDVQVALHTGEGGMSLDATLEARAVRADRSVRVTLRNARVATPGLPSMAAGSLAATLTPGGDAFPLQVEVEGGGAQLSKHVALAGAAGVVTLLDRQASEVEVDLEGSFSDSAAAGEPGQRLWDVKGRVRRDLSEGELTIAAARFELGRVPAMLSRLPLVASETATVAGQVKARFGEGRVRISGDVELAGLNIEHELLASSVVHDVGFALDFAATVDPESWRVEVEHARASHGGVSLELSGEIVHPPRREGRRYDVQLAVPPVPCQQVLDAIPPELVPSLRGFGLGGTFQANLTAKVDYSDLEALELGGNVDIWKCSVLRAPAAVSAARLRGPFSHRVTMKDGGERIVRLFPGSGTFTDVDAISPHMIGAVLTTEDGGFYRHRGFLPSQFEEAMRRNLKAGKIRLGASTITMQMVKNVMLTHERTLSRKLQEMFLTWYVEQTLSKDRIMEIYLNIVELAPGIYGITRAAEHYFGKHPRDLNPLESLYLSMMLPSPVRRHAHYCRGELSPRMDKGLRKMLRIMHDRGRIGDEDYETWKEADLLFDATDRGDTASCLAEIDRIMGGERGQRALSGLLAPPEAGGPLDEDIPERAYGELPSLADPDDPSEADAPGIPAMDEAAGAGEGA